MRSQPMYIAFACAMLLGWAQTADAVEIDVNIEGVYVDTSFSVLAPDFEVDADGDLATVSLQAGQGVLVTIDFANPTWAFVTDLFATIVIDGGQLTLLSADAAPEILINQPLGFPPPPSSFLVPPKPQFEVKINSPNPNGSPGEVWVQAVAFTGTGTLGPGPDIGAVQLFFEVTGASSGDTLDFQLVQTTGDVLGVQIPPLLFGATINLDTDGDQVPDGIDNCRLTANGPSEFSNQADADGDGFGTACDCDFDQDGFVLARDITLLFSAFNSTDPLFDLTGDGFILSNDAMICFGRFNTVVGDP